MIQILVSGPKNKPCTYLSFDSLGFSSPFETRLMLYLYVRLPQRVQRKLIRVIAAPIRLSTHRQLYIKQFHFVTSWSCAFISCDSNRCTKYSTLEESEHELLLRLEIPKASGPVISVMLAYPCPSHSALEVLRFARRPCGVSYSSVSGKDSFSSGLRITSNGSLQKV